VYGLYWVKTEFTFNFLKLHRPIRKLTHKTRAVLLETSLWVIVALPPTICTWSHASQPTHRLQSDVTLAKSAPFFSCSSTLSILPSVCSLYKSNFSLSYDIFSNKCSAPFMTQKWKSLDLVTKLDGSSGSKIGRWYGLTSLILFTIFKTKDKMWLAVLCNGRPMDCECRM